jgi:D-threo-aldose 1-dehydrogenase
LVSALQIKNGFQTGPNEVAMARMQEKAELGKTGIRVSPIIFGTSCLGNLYQALPLRTKNDIMAACFEHVAEPVVFDTAGKYGAGLALEVIGNGLRQLQIHREDVMISNKLGWLRTPLRHPEPTFEPGVWKDLRYDAAQKISYSGIHACWQQGCELLGGDYTPQIVSIHDPDEYIAQATTADERRKLTDDILEGYRALAELKQKGVVRAVGIGAKDWQVIRALARQVDLDWVMLAVSLTVMRHPPELLQFIADLHARQIGIINSAVFHSGFLTGGAHFNYRRLDPNNNEDLGLLRWRDQFNSCCERYSVSTAAACVQFGMSPPGVTSIALNTSRPERVAQNVATVKTAIPDDFWLALKETGLVAANYPYLG